MSAALNNIEIEKDTQAEEDEDLRPNACLVGDGVDAECLKGGEDDKDGRPAVVE